MLLGKGGIVHTCLMEGNRVHLSLHDIDFATLGYRLLGEMEPIEYRALVEYMRSRGVQILRKRVIHHTSCERNCMPHRVRDRKNNTTIELVPRLLTKSPDSMRNFASNPFSRRK